MTPPSTGNLSDTSVFIKFAKPITKTLSIGFMGAFELSQATLTPDAGGPFKIDLAYLYNLAAARTADVFGKRNTSLIGTIAFDYGKLLTSSPSTSPHQ